MFVRGFVVTTSVYSGYIMVLYGPYKVIRLASSPLIVLPRGGFGIREVPAMRLLFKRLFRVFRAI